MKNYPSNQDLIQIAQVLKSYGTQGEVMISFFSNAPEVIDIKEPIFIYFDELSVPFLIKTLTPKGKKKAVVLLNGIDTLELAEEIARKKVYLPSSLIEDDSESTPGLIGFSLYQGGKEGLLIGRIADIHDFSGNLCLGITNEETQEDLLIPFHEDLILEINEEKNYIVLEIPEGLLSH